MRTLALASARDEGPYLLEWIAHHRALGFDGVQIVSNDNTDGSNEMLSALARAGEIDHIDNPLEGTEDFRAHERANIQVRGYTRALRSAYLRASDWVMVLDIDEFLVLHQHDNVGEFVRSYRAESIAVDRLPFGSSGHRARQPGLVTERFTRCAGRPFRIADVKSISRVGAIRAFAGAHYPSLLPGARAVRCDGGPVLSYRDPTMVNFAVAQVNHYMVKSYEEFTARRARGDGVGPVATSGGKYTDAYFVAYDRNEAEDLAIRKYSGKMQEHLARLRAVVGA